jgi:hypothetical protein
MSKFDYILDKIANAPFESEPFRHVYIENLFSADHFLEITSAPEINIHPAESDEALFADLYKHNYKEIEFPGTTTNIKEYLRWHKKPFSDKPVDQRLCDGFGVTLRLQKPTDGSILQQLAQFFKSDDFWEIAAGKFNINLDDVKTDIGLQKYLDGYEISPHPDIRLKALTFMINMNPAPNSEAIDYHTHYLKFKPERQYVQSYWAEHRDEDRFWVPWSWCTTCKQQTRNNSVVLFSPADDTMHAVKASYNHLLTQRTQYYGNLWYKTSQVKTKPSWRDFAQAA